ncbi:LysM peptidoglycan-binding domain-containing protein [Faunimonas sp. B44]|uniref:LysM peptidoglycan-binding domain-containing protein n=1 Tax=Faunimonas sp. B44 TaxID=3461493 RepID=UPI004043CA75
MPTPLKYLVFAFGLVIAAGAGALVWHEARREPAVAERQETPAPAPAAGTAAAPEAGDGAPASDTAAAGPGAQPPGQSQPARATQDEIPTFDIVRVEPTGAILVAGRATPNAEIEVLSNGNVVARTRSDGSGAFVAVPDAPLAPGSHNVTLRAKPEGEAASDSEQQVAVAVPDRPDQEPLVVLNEPGAPSEILSRPGTTTVAALEPKQDAAGGNAAGASGGDGAAGRAQEQQAAAPAGGTERRTTAGPEPETRPAPEARDNAGAPPVGTSAGTSADGTPATGERDAEVAAATPQAAEARTDARETAAGAATEQAGGTQAADTQAADTQAAETQAAAPTETTAATREAPAATAEPPVATADARQPAGASTDGAGAAGASDGAPSAEPMATADARPAGGPSEADAAAAGTRDGAPAEKQAPTVSVDAVETEDDRLFVAGAAKPGLKVRVYVDNELVGETEPTAEGRWLLETDKAIREGDVTVRADQITPGTADVEARAEVPFVRRLDQASLVPAARGGAGTGASVDADLPGPNAVIIRRGDNLWTISRRTYGKGVRYSTIYTANKDQIRNPNRIYPGQVFVLPTRDEAWTEATEAVR